MSIGSGDREGSQSTVRLGPSQRTRIAPSSSAVPGDSSSEWETAPEEHSSKQTSSSRVDHLSSSLPSANAGFMPQSHSNRSVSSTHAQSTRRLWAAVRTSAKLAASPRKAGQDDTNSAFDAEGMSSELGGMSMRGNKRSSGTYLDQWSSIAHFLEEPSDEDYTERIPRKKATTALVGARTQPGSSSLQYPKGSTLTQEPESMIDSDPDHIPRREDPLAYNSGASLLDQDSESESEAEDEDEEFAQHSRSKQSSSRLEKIVFVLQKGPSPFAKTVIKCVLGYFVASLFTYSHFLSRHMALLLPQYDEREEVPISNLHFIATVAVYFHAGRTMGSMVEANIYALAAFLYSIVLGLVSMAAAVFLHEHELPVLSNCITVTVFIGFGMALVGYARVRINRPTFTTSCSLISVISFTVMVYEGSTHLGKFSLQKIWQVTLVVFVGVLISNVICFTVWPTRACTSLQLDICRSLESFSTLLKVLTKTFLLDDVKQFHIRSDRIKEAIDDHHASFMSLKRNLSEAQLEVPFDVRIRGRVTSYVRVVDSLNVLAQHLGGLRSSCGLQHEIILAHRNQQNDTAPKKTKTAIPENPSSDGLPSNKELEYLDKHFAAFSNFLQSVGPHMRSLVFTCSRTLKSLTMAFAATEDGIWQGDRSKSQSVDSFEILEKDVAAALQRFEHEQTVAIKRLYTVEPVQMNGERESKVPNTSNNLSKSDEDINLIFYFVFLLEEFSKELRSLIDAMETIRREEVKMQESRRRVWWKRLLVPASFAESGAGHSQRRRSKSTSKSHSFWKSIANLFRLSSSARIHLPSTTAHQENTKQTPLALTTRARISRYIWRLGQFFKEPDTKFAIKAGLGSAVLAAPAFMHRTRPTFTAYKGHWALLTFMVVLSPTVGQSNQASLHRSLGTMLGAALAVLGYSLFPDNNIALPIFGALFAVACFYWIISRPALASSGRLVLLTFNITALYSYNLRKTGIEVEEIAYHRTAAVLLGVAWATLLNHIVWPFEARRELARGLSDLLFKLGFLYQSVALSYSSNQDEDEDDSVEYNDDQLEEQPLIPAVNRKRDEKKSLELSLQVHLIKLEGLLQQTKNEPRLKGPFPVDTYKQFLRCCQSILDLLHTMNQVTSRSDWHSRVRQDFIIPIDQSGLRKQMVGNVGLFFWLLASAFHLKTPLPPFLPPAEASRRQVLEAIRQLPVVKRRAIRGSSEYLLYFAYALSMKDLIHQLEEIGRLAQSSFGVLGGSVEAFEAQFLIGLHSGQQTPNLRDTNE